MSRTAGPAAALAGVPAGVQSAGVWVGRRQLFVRFAGEAETATMYTAAALAGELKRLTSRSPFHSIAVVGRDALGNAPFLAAAFFEWEPTVPIMVDTDGQRPEAVAGLAKYLSLVQVTLDAAALDALVERGLETIATAAGAGCQHALVLAANDQTSDGQVMRVLERTHGVSEKTMVVIHPTPAVAGEPVDRRWGRLLEQAATVHGDVRLLLRLR